MIRVLVVEDSQAMAELLTRILESDGRIGVIAVARDGYEAIELSRMLKPDVITMDIMLPKLNGIETVRRIMSSDPVPTVVISAYVDSGDTGNAFLAREAGAIIVCEKPQGVPDFLNQVQAAKIVQAVKMASEITVVRRWKRPDNLPSWPSNASAEKKPVEVVSIGASTGGPPVLCEILKGLSGDYPVPILIVQHISPGFLPGMVEWLSLSSEFPVEIATDGMAALPGRAYFAPDGCHMEVNRSLHVQLTRSPPENGMRPSVSALFRSVARCFAQTGVGVILTGMGIDGADGLLLMRNEGAVTMAQDKASSAIFGMPAEAIRIGAAGLVLSPEQITETLNRCALGKGGKNGEGSQAIHTHS
jgi:two-component system chemotaxis response regulator CheB